MAGWLPGGRDHDRRLEALELELERLRAKSSADADRLAELATSVNRVADQIVSFSERLTTVADEAGEARANAAKLEEAIEAGSLGEARLKVEHEAMAATLGTMTEDLERLRGLDETVRALEAAEQQAKSDREELVKLRVAIKRAERQLELNADESRKTAAALLERVEALRVRLPTNPAPDPL
jgi:chromosome segregation ATPase